MVYKGRMKVFVRVKPMKGGQQGSDILECHEEKNGKIVTLHNPNSTTENNETKEMKFKFHQIFCLQFDNSSQAKVAETISNQLLMESWAGFNATLLAYGAQKSGKSYTLYGTQGDDGVVPTFIKRIFREIAVHKNRKVESRNATRYKLIISMVDIVNEKVTDLFNMDNSENSLPAGLKIREHPKYGPYCPALSLFEASTEYEAMKLILRSRRNTKGAHSILQVILTQTKFNWAKKQAATDVVSRVNIVDLGAPERQDKSKNLEIAEIHNSSNVNLNLATLGMVITKLSEGAEQKKNGAFIPYRDSKLTWLLRESLGGNSKCTLLSCISPSRSQYHYTLNTLRFAARASVIKNYAIVNEQANETIVAELKNEITSLQGILDSYEGKQEKDEEYYRIKAQLEESKYLQNTIKMDPKERKVQFEKEDKVKKDNLISQGVSIADLSNLIATDQGESPYIVNLKAQSRHDKMVYFLRDNVTKIGTAKDNNIILSDRAHVQEYHCIVEILNQNVYIIPYDKYKEESASLRDYDDGNSSDSFSMPKTGPVQCKIYVNGDLVTKRQKLRYCDRVALGDYIFRFHPKETDLIPETVVPESIIDWEMAKKEYVDKRTVELETRLLDLLPMENKLEKTKIELSKTEQRLESLRGDTHKLDYLQEFGDTPKSSGQHPQDMVKGWGWCNWKTWCCWLWCCPVICCACTYDGMKKKKEKKKVQSVENMPSERKKRNAKTEVNFDSIAKEKPKSGTFEYRDDVEIEDIEDEPSYLLSPRVIHLDESGEPIMNR